MGCVEGSRGSATCTLNSEAEYIPDEALARFSSHSRRILPSNGRNVGHYIDAPAREGEAGSRAVNTLTSQAADVSGSIPKLRGRSIC